MSPTKKDRTAYYAEYYRTHRKAQRKPSWTTKNCAFCGKPFAAKTQRAKYDSNVCRVKAQRAR